MPTVKCKATTYLLQHCPGGICTMGHYVNWNQLRNKLYCVLYFKVTSKIHNDWFRFTLVFSVAGLSARFCAHAVSACQLPTYHRFIDQWYPFTTTQFNPLPSLAAPSISSQANLIHIYSVTKSALKWLVCFKHWSPCFPKGNSSLFNWDTEFNLPY